MSRRRLRLITVGAFALALVASAIGAALIMDSGTGSAAAVSGEAGEMAPRMAAKRAAMQQFAPPESISKQEGERTSADDEWIKRATPGDDIPSAAIAGSRADWRTLKARGGDGKWMPLGPTWARSLPNPYRDRAVYNAGTQDFSGRISHVAIDPNCGSGNNGKGSCRLWIANANGGVWRTDNALVKQPEWHYLSSTFEHNSIGALELDPNDPSSDTIWAGTGESNGCGSGCEAGVGVYKSTDGGNTWKGPFGQDAFYNRTASSLEVKPGDSSTIFVASGRGIRGISSTCCGGVDSLIPGAPHFGLWRSTDGGANWTLVNQGANALCTASAPDLVSLNGTACSPRGARRVKIDPVDPNTVYASFFARGIWRSKSNGDPGTWEQIMAPIGPNPAFTTERAEFDLVALPNGNTRMYVGVGGGGVYARFRRNDDVRTPAAAVVKTTFVELTSPVQDTPGYSSFGYCDPQCFYDQYVFAPAGHFPNSGANPDIVYLSGDNEYSENNWGPLSPRYQGGNSGRSNGRGVAVSTNAGVSFTDMTDDDSDDFYPVELHPDHHALTVNPRNWKQFFDVGDGGIVRSNGVFVDDSADCVQPKGYTGTRLAFCQMMLSAVPERLEPLNRGLRTLHVYQFSVSPHNPNSIIFGTQDNGSWEIGSTQLAGTNSEQIPSEPGLLESDCRMGHGAGHAGSTNSNGEQIWVNTNIADGGHNVFDIGDRCFRMSSFQVGQTMVAYEPRNQLDMNWTSDTHWLPCPIGYACEANAFIGVTNDDRVHPHWLWSAREHVFRSTNQGRNPILTKETHRKHCNIWYGDADVDDNGIYEPAKDICDDWKPLGDPGPNGRLTSPIYGDRAGGYTAVVERARDSGTLWAATLTGRVFVSTNADAANPAAVVFDRIDNDPTATNDPPRFPSAIYVDPKDPNHAWITYSGFNAKTPTTPGHVFEVRYVPGASTFRLLDGNEPKDKMGDIPATAIQVTDSGTIFVGTDYGVVKSKGDGVWKPAGAGLPQMPVADIYYVHDPARGTDVLYAATHGQGVWELLFQGTEKR